MAWIKETFLDKQTGRSRRTYYNVDDIVRVNILSPAKGKSSEHATIVLRDGAEHSLTDPKAIKNLEAILMQMIE